MSSSGYTPRQLVVLVAMLLGLAALAAYSIWGSWPSSRATSAAPVTSAPAVTLQQPKSEHD